MISIPQDTIEKQRKASNPQTSAWVGANAGSGKTYVLAQRVVRLLFNGTDPSRILCLTFTKAAAAEMAMRVFNLLGEWTMLSDSELSERLESMEGTPPTSKQLSAARRLFARALETPGGLKIQTIHAFCEALLHQFPMEAEVAGHFTVLDERLQREILRESRFRVFRIATEKPSSEQGKALGVLVELMSDFKIESAINEIIEKRDKFERWIRSWKSITDALDALRKSLKVKPNETQLDVLDQMVKSQIFPQRRWKDLVSTLSSGGKSDISRSETISRAIYAQNPVEQAAIWFSVFFTKDQKPFKRLLTKEIDQKFPGLKDRLTQEQMRLEDLENHRKLVVTYTGTKSLLSLANSVLEKYEQIKKSRGLLDFEDLVIRTVNLLTGSNAALWVQYKLDNGLDHVLVDEAQDTSPRQWEMISALVSEFFAGSGARETLRTVFAVGDEKQSIFSFQGAEPTYFANMRRYFSSLAKEANQEFSEVQLNLSFRSTDEILGAVDKVFSHENAYRGLSNETVGTVHEGIRGNEPGLVEVWSPELQVKVEEDENWTVPIDREGPSSPIVRLAERVAERIANLIESGQFKAGDIMVLLRKRGPFIESLNRALKRRDIPIAGSDRLVLTDHIAVRDLISLGRILLLDEDDLSLAELLRSPLIGLTEEQLYTLAHGRIGSLRRELVKKSKTEKIFKDAHSSISSWRKIAERNRPFEFFSRVLGLNKGREKFRKRMGSEVDDVLDEFLALTLEYEASGIPSMEGFFSWLEAAPTQIKRELGTGTDAVRIMTVHGAKGLEAPVVFVVDSGARPVHSSHDPAILELSDTGERDGNPGFVWLPPKSDRPLEMQQVLEAFHELSREEYRRLLYVAITRARDQLYICSWAPIKGPAEDCWYKLASEALNENHMPKSEDMETPKNSRRQQHPDRKIQPKFTYHEKQQTGTTEQLPSWISKKVRRSRSHRKLVPSNALEIIGLNQPENEEWVRDTLDELIGEDSNNARLRGSFMHRLFEVLPEINQGERLTAALQIANQMSLKSKFQNFEELISEVLDILDNSEFSTVFSKNSKAEVSVVGRLEGIDGRKYDAMGQIDRLVVNENEVLIVDFKSNRIDIDTVDKVPKQYIAQLGIYYLLMQSYFPLHNVRAAILWTWNAKLMEIEEELLQSMASPFLSGQKLDS